MKMIRDDIYGDDDDVISIIVVTSGTNETEW